MSSTKNSETDSDSSIRIEGDLVNKLHSALDLTCKKFIASIKFSAVKRIYRAIHDKNPKALKGIYDQLCLQLKKSISEDLDQVCTDRSIDILLNTLEEINKLENSSQISWRPSGNPEEDLRDHIYPLKVMQKTALENELNKLIVANEEMVYLAEVNHAEIMHIKRCNEDLHEKFSNIFTNLNWEKLLHEEELAQCTNDKKYHMFSKVCMNKPCNCHYKSNHKIVASFTGPNLLDLQQNGKENFEEYM